MFRSCDRLEGCGEEKRSHSLKKLNCCASKNGGGWGEEIFARLLLGEVENRKEHSFYANYSM